MNEETKEYDVALSFAGEDREYVNQVAASLKNSGVRVFFDTYEVVALWGKNLYSHLQEVYSNKARFTVMFISKHYKEKLWTNHERESAQARAFSEKAEYILPVRFDDTQIPGVLPTVGYIDLRKHSPDQLAELIRQKINVEAESRTFRTKPSRKFQVESYELLFKFAFGTAGLNFSQGAAREWALRKMEQFPDVDLKAYVARYQELLDFAFSISGLNMRKAEAVNWATEKMEQFPDVDLKAYVARFKELLDFAFSISGLNMDKAGAVNWATEQLDREYFT